MAKKKFSVDNIMNPNKTPKKDLLGSFDKEQMQNLEAVSGSSLGGGAASSSFEEQDRLLSTNQNYEVGASTESLLAKQQGLGEQLWNTGAGFVTQAVGGFLSGADWDVQGMVNTFQGKEKEFGSWLSNIGKDVLKYSQENHQIYQDGDSFFDPEYWMKAYQNLGFTAGIIGEAFAEQALLSAITVESLGAGAGLQAIAASRKASLIKNALFGGAQGIKEAYMNASETGEKTYKKYISLGYSDEEAKKYAGEAAAMGMQMEMGPTMVLNALQFATIGKYNPFSKNTGGLNSGISGAVESIVDPIANKVKGDLAKKAVGFGVNALSEGVEEGMQTAISQYAEHAVLKKTNDIATDYSIFNREVGDSVLNGILGGFLFSGMGKARNELSRRKVKKQTGKAYDEFLTSMGKQTKDNLSQLKEAMEAGGKIHERDLRHKIQKENVFASLRLDYLRQDESAFNAYVHSLNNVLESINTKDTAKLKELGITEEDIPHIRENYQNYIDDAVGLKDKFVTNYEKYQDFTTAFAIADSQQVLDYVNNTIEENNNTVETVKMMGGMYDQMSDAGKQHFDLMVEHSGLTVSEYVHNTDHSTRKNEIREELEGIDELSAQDSTLAEAMDMDTILEYTVDSQRLLTTKQKALDNIKFWKDPKNRKAYKIADAKQKIKSDATSVQDLKETKEELSKDDNLTEELEEQIDASIAEKEVEALNEKDDIPDVNPETPENPQRVSQAELLKTLTLPTEEDYQNFLDAPLEVKSNPEALKKFSNALKTYEDSLEFDLGRTPTFEELVRDFIKHNDKAVADKLFDVLALGWVENGHKPTAFKDIYNKIFLDRGELSVDLKNLAEALVGPIIEDKETLHVENQEHIEEVLTKETPAVALDTNNQPIVEVHKRKASDPLLRAAFLNIEYLEEDGTKVDASEALLESSDINAKALMSSEVANKGDMLTVKIPSNFQDIVIQTWEDSFTKGPSMPFKSWVDLTKAQVGSKEYNEKVPMIAYQGDTPLFFIHDTDWYSMPNTGLENDLKAKAQLIKASKEILSTFRNKVVNNPQGFNIEISEKRVGTFNEYAEPVPIQTANPQSKLGVYTPSGLMVDGKVFTEQGNSLINKRDLHVGNTYDIRKGVNKGEFIALEVQRPKQLEQATQDTLYKAFEIFLMQQDINSKYSDRQALTKDNKKFQDLGNFNLGSTIHTQKPNNHITDDDFTKLVSSFTRIHYVNDTNNLDAIITNSNQIAHGEPFILKHKKVIVIGVKGKKINQDKQYIFLNPMTVRDETLPTFVVDNFFKILKDRVLPGIKPNVSETGLYENKKVMTMAEGQISVGDDYQTYLKKNLQTNVKSYNVGTAQKPDYATFTQPVINFQPAKTQVEQVQEKEVVPKEVVEEVAEKVVNNQPLTQDEEIMTALIEANYVEDAKLEIEEAVVEKLTENESKLAEYFAPQLKQTTNKPAQLTIVEQFQIVDHVFNTVASKVSFNYKSTTDKDALLAETKKALMNILNDSTSLNNKLLEELEGKQQAEYSEEREASIEKLHTLNRQAKAIKDNYESIQAQAMKKVSKYTGITEVPDKIFGTTSLEENGKTTASYRLKRFFSGIKQTNKDGTFKKGFLNIPLYIGFDSVYAHLEQIMASPSEVDSDFDLMIVRLEENINAHPWLQQVIDKLKTADGQIKNEFVYNYHKHALSMKFGTFKGDSVLGYKLKVFDTNSNEVTRVIRRSWETAFKQSELVEVVDGKHVINKDRAEVLSTVFKNWVVDYKKKGNIPTQELQLWLKDFGISLTESTIEELKSSPQSYIDSKGFSKLNFPQLFRKTSNGSGIFGLLADYLDKMQVKGDTSFDENPSNHPYNNLNNVLKVIAKLESKHSNYATVNSFRDGGKSIYGFTQTKWATDAVGRLKYDGQFRANLSNKDFNKHSYILDMLNDSAAFQEKFNIHHLGITALSQVGADYYGDSSVTSLSNADHELTKMIMFQDMEQGEIRGGLGNTINFRMAKVFLPTMSDKSQMLLLDTAALNLKMNHFQAKGDDLTMSHELKEVLYSQLVRPELNRLVNYVAKGEKSNIKGYDFGARMFHFIPSVNGLVDTETGLPALQLMSENPHIYNQEWFETNMKDQVFELLEEMFKEKVNKKLTKLQDSQFYNEATGAISYIDNKYKGKFPTDNPKLALKYMSYDYIINNYLANANSFMLLAGDVALYSQNKVKKNFKDGKIYLPKNPNVYDKISKDTIGVNVGKRLALLLAPGSKIANSKGEKYRQIFLNDYVDLSDNILELIELFHGKKAATDSAQMVQNYYQSTNEDTRDKISKTLQNKFPDLGGYFELEATDAQEYTTLKEHLNILYRQGRLAEGKFEELMSKADGQYKSTASGRPIKKEDIISTEDLKIIYQPLKPVHTGFHNDLENNVMRMMYIKSSSFPLIPQVTQGLELDTLRLAMEKFEGETGQFVRASYETANKVGANTNAITPFDFSGRGNAIDMNQMRMASLELDRDNFKIQQDVPFKSGKKDKDTVSLVSQALKLLFGDGVMDLDGFKFNGKEYKGKDLQRIFNDNYVNLIEGKRQMLFAELGLDNEGKTKDIEFTVEKLQNMLKAEAEDRDYPKQDIEALKVRPVLDSTGKIVDLEFNIPLWLSPNSNRYEALLNALITNRMIKIKLPGSSFVAGSEAGFKVQNTLGDIDPNSIVYTSAFNGDSLQAYKQGNLTQVFMPPKFRTSNGKVIEFIRPDGKPNSKYVDFNSKGQMVLKEDMVDPELLNISSFRIPTSSHVSMSQIQIAGFLPHAVGDLIIVPRNLTQQKGLDFDVDKETTYMLNTYTTDEGAVKVIDEAYVNQKIEELEKNMQEALESSKNIDNILLMFDKLLPFEQDIADANTTGVQEKFDRSVQKLRTKLHENNMIKIHSSVLSNPNPEMQKKINKILSMDFAKSQAELIQGLSDSTEGGIFSMLDDEYQKDKMFLGAAGRIGIGVYSNYVVFHSIAQQLKKPIQTVAYVNEEIVPVNFTFGNIRVDGALGSQKTKARFDWLVRSISEVLAERQNTATDNEKEQIMGRVNINSHTINVDSYLVSLGVDKDAFQVSEEEATKNPDSVVFKNGKYYKVISYPYFLLSQPIIKELVSRLQAADAITGDVNYDDKVTIAAKLAKEMKLGTDMEFDEALLKSENLYRALEEGEFDKDLQGAVLRRFLHLDHYAQKISQIQKVTNINNGLGKSHIEALDKHSKLRGFNSKFNLHFRGVSELIGDYVSHDKTPNRPDLTGVTMGGNIVTPTTPAGAMAVYSVHAAEKLWGPYFPQSDPRIKQVFNSILSTFKNKPENTVKIYEEIMQEMKKFLYSSHRIGTIYGRDIQTRRQQMFFDYPGNQALASYISNLRTSNNDVIANNKLLSRFEFDLNQGHKPSIIKFNNSKSENFDEDYLYNSLLELFEANEALPNKNGQRYTTSDLVQDLVSYSFLEGGVQEAIQFMKYIPIEIMDNMGFAEVARSWKGEMLYEALGGSQESFVRQFIQHNSNRLPSISTKDMLNVEYVNKTKDAAQIKKFFIGDEDGNVIDGDIEYFKMKTSQGINIYAHQADGSYHIIPTLGTYGMAEYDMSGATPRSLINTNYYQYEFTGKSQTPVYLTEDNMDSISRFNIQSGNLQEIVSSIASSEDSSYGHLVNLAKAIESFVPHNTEVVVKDVVNKNGDLVAAARYYKGNKLQISEKFLKSATDEELAKTLLHEVLHAVTSSYLDTYFTPEGELKSGISLPQEVQELNMLYKEVQRQIGLDKIEAFKKKRAEQLNGASTKLTMEERKIIYGATSIDEFLTYSLTEPEFQKEMEKFKYLQSGKSLFDKLASIVNNILVKILGPEYKIGGLTYQSVRASLKVVKAASESQSKGLFDSMYVTNFKGEDVLSRQVGKIYNKGLDFSKENANFGFNPFDC